MAQVINKTNHLAKDANKYKTRMIMWVIAFFFNFFVLFFEIPIIAVPLHVVFGYLIGKNHKQYKKLKSGLEGENRTLQTLQSLGEGYSVVNDLKIELDGKTSQIDTVIVGDNGIFVVETKNVKGYIEGFATDKTLLVHKEGRKGGQYTKEIYNPIKQVGTHVFRLSSVLKRNGFNVWVQGVVFFSNSESDVDIRGKDWKMPIFTYRNRGSEALNNYITNYKGNSLPKQVQREIVDLLKKHIIN